MLYYTFRTTWLRDAAYLQIFPGFFQPIRDVCKLTVAPTGKKADPLKSHFFFDM